MVEEIDTHAEAQLVSKAAQGDFGAFEALVRTYSPAVWRFIYSFVGNSADAHDLLQQTLIQVYDALPTLRNPTRFRAWLFTIARHACLDHLRRPTPYTFSDLDSAALSEVANAPTAHFVDPTPQPDVLAERRETHRVLWAAIATLAERQRAVVTLRYTTDLSFGEIGEVLGLNENTVKTLFQRAKGQLRTYLRERL